MRRLGIMASINERKRKYRWRGMAKRRKRRRSAWRRKAKKRQWRRKIITKMKMATAKS